MARILQFLIRLLPIINPLQNETTSRAIGSAFTIVCALVSAVVLAIQVFGGAAASDGAEGTQKATDAFEAATIPADSPDAHDVYQTDSIFSSEVSE